MRIGHRIALLGIISTIAICALSGYSVYQAKINAAEVKIVTEGVVPSALATVDLISQVAQLQLTAISLVKFPDSSLAEQAKKSLLLPEEAIRRDTVFQYSHANNAVQRGLVEQTREKLLDYFAAIDQLVSLKLAGQQEVAEATYYGNVVVLQRELQQVIETLRIEKSRENDQAVAILNANLSRAATGILFVSLFIIVVLAFYTVILYQKITGSLSGLQGAMNEIKDSADFTRRLDISSNDEAGDTARTFNELIKSIQTFRNQAEAASRAKCDFVANMSHEIRTPMHAVIGFAEMAQDSNDIEESRMFSQHILESSQSLMAVLNDILDFSRMDAQQLTIESQMFDLDELLNRAQETYLYIAKDKGLEFTFVKDAQIPQYVTGDPDRLKQILSNLLSNAVKFTSHGFISLNVQRIKASDELVKINFSVKDSGVGIKPEQMVMLFQPFSQADNSITRRFGGTGLGLVISRNLARLMNGDIYLETQYGVGSEFRLEVTLNAVKEH